ncbi:ABC transporter permease [Desertihabitans brevis]|uniref:Transport permease protein n=1 Tax=Desertihabitans brevis TaxID=2268447 RepID=A0A367YW35_9ACTN|nr:ABC transporter permease [Desertihabitans brevis]RCK70084.1 ABC transporter permease [Desertihabitans brevis]
MTTSDLVLPTRGGAAPDRRTSSVLSDTGNVWLRETLTIVRDPFSLIFSLLQPLIFLGLFGPLLSGFTGGQDLGGVSPLQWFLPGVVVMITMFGTSMTGSNLQYEIMTGAFERILATPLSRPALMIGRALKELTPLVVQGLIICAVAAPFGFVIHPLGILLGLLLLGVFGVGIGALSYSLAIAARKNEWVFWAVQQTLLFPLLILSGMMLPLEAGPGWMRLASQFNPLTYVVEAERALFAGVLADPSVLWGFVAAFVTAAIGLVVGVRTVTRSIF